MTKDELLKTLDTVFEATDAGPEKLALDVAIDVIQTVSNGVTDSRVETAHKAVAEYHKQ